MKVIVIFCVLAVTTHAASWQGRVTGGTRAAVGQFPNTGWVADEDYSFVTSCWIFNERWVVSKGFGSDRTPANTKLIFGTASLTFEEKVYNHTVIDIVNHPSFNAETLENNISLLQTKVNIYFTLYVQAFPPFPDPVQVPVIATVVGFGQSNTNEPNNYLHYITLSTINNEECKARQVDPDIRDRIDDRVICLDTDENGFGNCIGDEGSALIAKGTVVGTKAFSGKCNLGAKAPDVFLRISYYKPWLISVAGAPVE